MDNLTRWSVLLVAVATISLGTRLIVYMEQTAAWQRQMQARMDSVEEWIQHLSGGAAKRKP